MLNVVFETHIKMEEMIAAEEYSSVKYYIDEMWTAMKNPYMWTATNVLFGCIAILLLSFPSLYPKTHQI